MIEEWIMRWFGWGTIRDLKHYEEVSKRAYVPYCRLGDYLGKERGNENVLKEEMILHDLKLE
jgi:hypothetical protein